MQIRASLLQRILGGGGGEWANLVERLSPSFHCPWLSFVAVLVVVGSIPPGDFCFIFWQICCFGLHTQRRTARDFGRVEKMVVGDLLTSRSWIPQHQKPRSWRGKPSVLRVPFGHSGAL